MKPIMIYPEGLQVEATNTTLVTKLRVRLPYTFMMKLEEYHRYVLMKKNSP